MQREIALILDIDKLTGTDYFEFLPGKYSGSCWDKRSAFLYEAAFTLIEKPFENNIDGYDHYSFVEITKPQIDLLIVELTHLKIRLEGSSQEDLDAVLKFLFTQTRAQFTEDFSQNKGATIKMIDDLVSWFAKTKSEEECITILGL